MTKFFGTFLFLVSLNFFLIPVVYSKEIPESAENESSGESAQPVRKSRSAKKSAPTLTMLKNDVDELQKGMVTVTKSQSAILRLLEQPQVNQCEKMGKSDSFSYP